MTKAKTKTKKIILLVVATLLVLLILLGCVILWVPGFWHPIDYFSQYEGMLDSPITEITLWHGGYDVTFSDPDLLNSWEEGLEQLQLQKNGVQLLSAGGESDQVVIRTETGEYLLTRVGDEMMIGSFWFTLNDPDYFPFEETFLEAVQRQGLE